jgi:TolB protein
MATKDFLSATKPLARSRALLVLACVALAMLVACGVAAVAALEDAKAAFPGKNGKIVFSTITLDGSEGEQIYSMNADGSGVTKLTDLPGENFEPDGSADGQKIAFFNAFCSGDPSEGGVCTNDIYVMNADGSKMLNLTSNLAASAFFNPSWFPTANTILFLSDPHGQLDLYALTFDSLGNTTRLKRLTKNAANEQDAVVSPDGTKIAFTRNENVDSTLTSVLYVMKRVGPKWTRVRPTRLAYDASDPDWSPDGTKIAFSRNTGLFVMNADGTSQTRITAGGFPTFSPDGKKIAFSGGGDIYVINAAPESDTNPRVNLTADTPGAAQRDPDWQPLP